MDREAVEHSYGGGDQTRRLLNSLLAVGPDMDMEEYGPPAEDREISLVGLTLVLLHSTVDLIADDVDITEENYRGIATAARATYQIWEKFPLGKNVYHDLLDSALRTLQVKSDPTAPTEISSKMSAERSMHGVLNNLAIKLVDNVFGLLNLLGEEDTNSVNSQLGPLLESLNCTLGFLNRALDPLPGGKYAMEGELYTVHLTPHKSPLVQTRISEPTVSYCCNSYRQLIMQ